MVFSMPCYTFIILICLYINQNLFMKINKSSTKGRGAQSNPEHRYASRFLDSEIQDFCEDNISNIATKYIEVFPKTIVNKVKSIDLPLEYSLNPYEGCEHGCTYCYARNTHPYWGYSAGLDFERIILYKKNAPTLLRNTFNTPKWKPSPVMLSGNTDCYQPIEQKLRITRQLLEVFLEFKHPVGIITKNHLILRDVDILQELAKLQLTGVVISITTRNEELRRSMEPRTSAYAQRMNAVRVLSSIGIPVTVLIAPIIPGLNDTEILSIAKDCADNGAQQIGHTIARLPGEVERVFTDWLSMTMPDRKERILRGIASLHGGNVQDTKPGRRMRGEGEVADVIHQQMALARKLYFKDRQAAIMRCDLFINDYNRQGTLF